jgi:hypothetical protein
MRLQLIALACGLAPGTAGAQSWRLAADTMFYTDTDNVMVVTPQLAIHRAIGDEPGEVFARASVDVTTAASVDVVSHATNGFTEARTEATFGGSYAFGGVVPALSYTFSIEPDYVSHGGLVGIEAELGTPDSVFFGSYGLVHDTIGMADTPFDAFSETLVTQAAELGFTQTLGESTLLRGAYTLTAQLGHMAKPYRFVPLFDLASIERASMTGVAIDLDTFDRYRSSARPPEEVPDARLRNALALRALQFVEPADLSLRLDYRFYFDSWEVIAHTVELAAFFAFGESVRLEIHARAHLQSHASFYERLYVVTSQDEIPRYRTVDKNLSTYETYSSGARLEIDADPVKLYAGADVLFTDFADSLFIDWRLAVVTSAGIRIAP